MEEPTNHLENPPAKKGQNSLINFTLTFIFVFPTWILLSGRFDLFHLGFGVVASAMVSYFSGDLVFSLIDVRSEFSKFPAFFMYLPWLIYQVFLASINVMYLVFHPRMLEKIDPKIIRFKSDLKGHLALTIFANSITLTPGTITIYASDFGDFSVHAIDGKSGDALPGEMEERVAKIFGKL